MSGSGNHSPKPDWTGRTVWSVVAVFGLAVEYASGRGSGLLSKSRPAAFPDHVDEQCQRGGHNEESDAESEGE